MKSVTLTVCLAVAASAQAQSLADLARQERERKQNIESKVVITTDTLKSSSATLTTAPATAVPATAGQAASTDKAAEKPATSGPADRQGRDEKFWRAAFATARQELARAEAEIKVAENRLNQAHRDLLQRGDLFNKEQRSSDEINAANADLETGRRNAETARGKIASLEDDLRRSGGPAGWAR